MAAPRNRVAPRLRHRIRIERPVVTRDDYGGEVTTWTTVATVYAAIAPVAGREYLEARAINDETIVRFWIRWAESFNTRNGLGQDMRIVDPSTGYVYDIESVNHLMHGRRQIEMVARLTNERTS